MSFPTQRTFLIIKLKTWGLRTPDVLLGHRLDPKWYDVGFGDDKGWCPEEGTGLKMLVLHTEKSQNS